MYITIILNTTATNYNTFIKYIGGAIVVITSKPIFDFHSNLDLLIAFFIQGTMEEKIYDRQVRHCILYFKLETYIRHLTLHGNLCVAGDEAIYVPACY
jgi:hypothetical protein